MPQLVEDHPLGTLPLFKRRRISYEFSIGSTPEKNLREKEWPAPASASTSVL